jgi:hypothetical protein
MPWRKVIPSLLLFALAAALAGGNLWFTAARSTIPLSLDTKILGHEVRREKHPGRDDVYLLVLAGLGQMQVDREIYDAVAIGETLHKEGQSRELLHGDKVLPLDWSRDHRGMLLAMPLCLGVLAAILATVLSVARPKPS